MAGTRADSPRESRPWWHDGRAWLLAASLVVIFLADLASPGTGLLPFMLVPVLLAVPFAGPWITAALVALAFVLAATSGLVNDYVQMRGYRVRLATLVIVGVLAVLLAKLQRAGAERQAAAEARYRLLAENASDVVFRGSAEGGVQWISPSVEPLLGWRPAELIGKQLVDYAHPDDLPTLALAFAPLLHGEKADCEGRFRRADGSYLWLALTVRPVDDGDGIHLGAIGSARDVTESHEAHERLAFLATHDPLTSLTTRAELIDWMTRTQAHQPRLGTRLGVLFCDLDDMKGVNDTFGHLAGDRVLVEVAHRLVVQVRAEDVVARIGGDEFVVAMAGLSTATDAERIAAKIHAAMLPPVAAEEHDIDVNLSIGVAVAEAGELPEHVLRRADLALYRAKRSGSALTATYEPGVDGLSHPARDPAL